MPCCPKPGSKSCRVPVADPIAIGVFKACVEIALATLIRVHSFTT